MTNKGDVLLIPADAMVESLDVNLHNMRQINSIKDRYPDLRQRSKAP